MQGENTSILSYYLSVLDVYFFIFSTQCVYKSVIMLLKVHLATAATYPASYDAALSFGQCLKFMSG